MSMTGRTVLWRWRAQNSLAGTAVGAEGGHGIASRPLRGIPNIPRRILLGLPLAVVLVGLALFLCKRYQGPFAARHLLPFLFAVAVSALVGGVFPTILAIAASAVVLESFLPAATVGRPIFSALIDILALSGVGALTLGLDRRRLRAISDTAKVRSELESRVERRTEELAGAVARLRREIQARQRTQDELRSVTAHARCILWRAELEGGKDWEQDSASSSRWMAWKVWVQDEQAAQSVLPLELSEGGAYYRAWVQSRHPDDALAAGRVCKAALLGGRSSYSHEYRCYDRYGHERWLSEEVQIQQIAPGRWSLFGVTTDATARKLASEQLRASEERFALFMEHLPGVAFIKDHKDRYVFMNRACERLFIHSAHERASGGPGNGEPAGANVDALMDLFPERDADVLAAEHNVQSVEVVRQAHATQFYLMHKFEIPTRDGRSVLLGGVAIDMTEQKRAEEEILEHRRRLRALAAEVSRTEERERRQIAAALHDQIGSLLAVSQMQLETLRMSEGKDCLTDANRAVLDDVVSSIEEAIAHSRSLTCELSPPLLYEAGLEAAVSWLGDQIRRRHGLPVEVEGRGDVRSLDLECKVLLFQGVRELLTNTVKHAQAGLARVEIDVDAAQIRVVVSDDGVGIGQSESTRPNGFGLFHLRERLEYLGGQMEVVSAPGQGTRTMMSIPRERQTAG
jgi:signal transduction histidine kinase